MGEACAEIGVTPEKLRTEFRRAGLQPPWLYIGAAFDGADDGPAQPAPPLESLLTDAAAHADNLRRALTDCATAVRAGKSESALLLLQRASELARGY